MRWMSPINSTRYLPMIARNNRRARSTRSSGRHRLRFFLICSIALLVWVGGVGGVDNVVAGGLEIGDQGAKAAGRAGAFTVRADDPSALYYNPAGLARLRGTQVYYSHRLLYGQAEYRRARTLDWSDATHGTPQLVDFEHVTNQAPLFPTGLMLAASSDFGLDDVTFAAGVYGPPAVGHVQYPEQRPPALSTDRDGCFAFVLHLGGCMEIR